jgi:NADH-quinone oxidoreductase subunit M
LSLLDLLIVLPILAAVVMAFGLPARPAALAAACANLAIGLLLAFRFDYGNATAFQFAAIRPVLDNPAIGLNVGIDGMSLVMVLLTVLVTFAAIWIRPARGTDDALYYASSLLIAAGAAGAFVSTDLLFFYAFHELALIPTFLMIGMRGTGNNKDAAWKITIYLGLGSLVLLAGLAFLITAPAGGVSTFDMTKLGALTRTIEGPVQERIYLVLLLGFGTLVSLFPFHSWAAPAYASAPAPVTMLHAGVLKKFGLYGLLRVAVPMLPLGHSAEWIQHLLIVLLVGNILFVGLVTIAQKEVDTMLGNSSVMHMGYIFLGIASGSAIGYSGAVLLMFAHGVSIALLFALSASIREKTGTLQFHRLGGLAQSAPFLGLAFGMAAFASIGLPGFANFAAEINIFFSGFASKSPNHFGWLQTGTVLALWGVVISAVYMLRAFRAVFKGPLPDSLKSPVSDLTLSERIPALLLLAALLLTGFAPNLLLRAVNPVVQAITAAAAR